MPSLAKAKKGARVLQMSSSYHWQVGLLPDLSSGIKLSTSFAALVYSPSRCFQPSFKCRYVRNPLLPCRCRARIWTCHPMVYPGPPTAKSSTWNSEAWHTPTASWYMPPELVYLFLLPLPLVSFFSLSPLIFPLPYQSWVNLLILMPSRVPFPSSSFDVSPRRRKSTTRTRSFNRPRRRSMPTPSSLCRCARPGSGPTSRVKVSRST